MSEGKTSASDQSSASKRHAILISRVLAPVIAVAFPLCGYAIYEGGYIGEIAKVLALALAGLGLALTLILLTEIAQQKE